MTTGNSLKREYDTTFADPVPYFTRAGTNTGLWDHLFPHLQLKRRPTTSNPYAKSRQGFHTTFYDIREPKDLEARELWKHGPLYDHPLGWHFRKCAYTVSFRVGLKRQILSYPFSSIALCLMRMEMLTGSLR